MSTTQCFLATLKRKTYRKGSPERARGLVSEMVDAATGKRPADGAIFPAHHYLPWLKDPHTPESRKVLAPNYYRDNAHREPLVVVIPGQHWFIVDSQPTGGGEGWVVRGTAPLLTVTPSIHLVGLWHGFLTNGVLTG